MSSDPWAGVAVLDAHAHLGARLLPRYLAAMRECTIQEAFVVPAAVVSPYELSRGIVAGGPGHDVDADNDGLADAVAGHPQLHRFHFVNPHRPATAADDAGVAHSAGVKFAPAVHGVGHLDERSQSFIALARRHRKPVYSHCVGTGDRSVEAYARLAERHPDVTFVLGHGGRGNFDLPAVAAIRPCQNVLFETSGAFDGAVTAALDALGPERVLFGSEFPIQHPRVELTKLAGVVPREHLAAVLGGNARRLLGPVPAPIPAPARKG